MVISILVKHQNSLSSQIGGGYPEHDLSDITLTWMAVCYLLT